MKGAGTGKRAVVVADGDVPSRAELDAAWPGWDAEVSLVVAADGGWDKAVALGLRPDLLVGDADSLPEERFRAVAARRRPDRALPGRQRRVGYGAGIAAALRRGATAITVLGALGGRRFDHALANVGLLSLPGQGDADVELLDGRTRIRLMRAPAADGRSRGVRPGGRPGDLVSLLPQGVPAVGVTTDGLLYPLADETLRPGPARGLSNVLTAALASVRLRAGWLLVVETKPDREDGNKSEETAGDET